MNLPPLNVVTAPGAGTDVIILGLADSAGTPVVVGVPDSLAADFSHGFAGTIESMAAQIGATPKPGSTAVLPGPSGPIVLTGLGDADVTPDRVRRAAANGVRRALEASGDLQQLESQVAQTRAAYEAAAQTVSRLRAKAARAVACFSWAGPKPTHCSAAATTPTSPVPSASQA